MGIDVTGLDVHVEGPGDTLNILGIHNTREDLHDGSKHVNGSIKGRNITETNDDNIHETNDKKTYKKIQRRIFKRVRLTNVTYVDNNFTLGCLKAQKSWHWMDIKSTFHLSSQQEKILPRRML